MSTEVDLSKLMALSVGDVIEGFPLMASLSPEHTLMTVVSATQKEVVFYITYFGVLLGRKTLTNSKKGPAWTSSSV